MNEATKAKAPEEPVKLGVWILPSEREALYANTRELGFTNFSDLIRTIAGLNKSDWTKMAALKSILTGALDEDVESRDVYAVQVSGRTGEILRDKAKDKRFENAAAYAASLLEKEEGYSADEDLSNTITSTQISVDNLESRDLALRERVAYLENLLLPSPPPETRRMNVEISVPLLVMKATHSAIESLGRSNSRKAKSASNALESIKKEGRHEKTTPEKRGCFVGSPASEDVGKLLGALWEIPFSMGPQYAVDTFKIEEVLAIWERAYAQLTGKNFRARYNHEI
jgi:hypothetical protein